MCFKDHLKSMVYYNERDSPFLSHGSFIFRFDLCNDVRFHMLKTDDVK